MGLFNSKDKTLLEQQDEDYHRAVKEDEEKLKREKTEEILRIEKMRIEEEKRNVLIINNF